MDENNNQCLPNNNNIENMQLNNFTDIPKNQHRMHTDASMCETRSGRKRRASAKCLSSCCNEEVTEEEMKKIRRLERQERRRPSSRRASSTPVFNSKKTNTSGHGSTRGDHQAVTGPAESNSDSNYQQACSSWHNTQHTQADNIPAGPQDLNNNTMQQENPNNDHLNANGRQAHQNAQCSGGGGTNKSTSVPAMVWNSQGPVSALDKLSMIIQGKRQSNPQPVVNSWVYM